MHGKKYLWALENADQQHGLFETVDAAVNDAREILTEDGHDRAQHVDIFDARPALPNDAYLFDGADEDEGGCDTSKPDWCKDKWVPENIVHQFIFDPNAEPTSED